MRENIAIIGSGPAGISAAITAKLRNKSVLLFGSGGISGKVSRAHLIRNYPALPDISGEQLAKALDEHLCLMEIPIRRERVTMVYSMGSYFAVQTSAGMYEADRVILATGVVQERLLSGETELLGKGVSYCATCDAFLYRGRSVAVIGYSDEAAAEAEFLADGCERVWYIPMKGAAAPERENITVIRQKPLAVLGEGKVSALKTDGGELSVDGVFILREASLPQTLVPGIEVRDGHIVVDMQMRTNIDGCYACGDVTGKPYQYIKAAGQGNVAALSAVADIPPQSAG